MTCSSGNSSSSNKDIYMSTEVVVDIHVALSLECVVEYSHQAGNTHLAGREVLSKSSLSSCIDRSCC
jgi:hypothetical protein